jgi:ubiquinone biosynthesis protein COQ9
MPHPIDPTREALLRAILPHVPFEGWSEAAFRRAARDAEVTLAEARAAAPSGGLDLAVEWHREGDRAMVRALREAPEGMRLRERVAHALKARVAAMDDREALRRSAALLALPVNAGLGARLLWETADAAWTALGDASRDGNWYTKRATLAAVLASVALFRLGDDSPGAERTMAFVDRRIDDVMAFEAWKRSAGANPLLRPLAAPLGWLMGRVRAPERPADLAGTWAEEP